MESASQGKASLIGSAFGNYEVLGLIGRGAMGTVYLAKDIGLDRYVALKVLLGSVARNPAHVKSFHREAQAAAPLNHSGIVRIYSAGLTNGTPYIAMEYVEGEPLDRFIKRTGPLKWQTAFYIASQAAQALQCAHDSGIVHRDIKPGNMLLDRSGRVRLTDFGIAKFQSDASVTIHENGFVGTPHYMSPEQCEGNRAGVTSDLYSLGVVVFEMISGQKPFHADTPMALAKRIVTEEPPRLNRIMIGVPDDVARLTAHLMQKRPEDRPQSAREVYESIERIQREEGGRSAMSAALDQFLKEQADIRPISITVTGNSKKSRAIASAKRTSGYTSKRRWLYVGAAAAVSMCMLVVAAFVLASSAADSTRNAPVLADVVFTKTAGSGVVASLPSSGYRYSALHWIGNTPLVLAEVEGKPDSLLRGERGLLAIAVDDERALSIAPPTASRTETPHVWRPVITAALSGVLAATAIHRPTKSDNAPQVMFARAVRDSEDTVSVQYTKKLLYGLFEPDTATHSVAFTPPGVLPTPICAVLHPNGNTLCLVETDVETRSNFLVERTVAERFGLERERRLTSKGANIEPRSIQYTSDGNQVVYLRQAVHVGSAVESHERGLWVVNSGAAEMDGKLLGVADFEDTPAFSPDGRLIAVSVHDGNSNTSSVRLVQALDGEIVAELGPGHVSSEAWHPSGDIILMTAPVADGAAQKIGDQVFAVEIQGSFRRTQLTRYDGSLKTCVVSRDGRWAAAIDGSGVEPKILFVDVSKIAFGNVI